MGVTARKEEISIMKLLGATNSFISAPFVTEGIIIGIIGSLIPLFILYFIYNRILIFISEKFMNVLKQFNLQIYLDVFSVLTPFNIDNRDWNRFLGSVNTVRRQIKKVEVS